MREVVANQFANKDIYQKVTDYLERHNYPRLVNRDNLIISVFPEAFPDKWSQRNMKIIRKFRKSTSLSLIYHKYTRDNSIGSIYRRYNG